MTVLSVRRVEPTMLPDMDRLDVRSALSGQWTRILAPTLVCALLAFAGSFLMQARYVATATFFPPSEPTRSLPEDPRSIELSDIYAGIGLSGDAYQYMSLMQSALITDRLADRFQLDTVYGVQGRDDTRRMLARHTRIAGGRSDGLIAVSVEDSDPLRAASIANAYAAELGTLVAHLAIGQAQQRLVFFEQLAGDSDTRLAAAQRALSEGGFDNAALRMDAGATADLYVGAQSALAEAEVTLAGLESTRGAAHPQVLTQSATIATLRRQTANIAARQPTATADYVRIYREFTYQRTLNEVLRRQTDGARMDAGRNLPLVEIVDPAQPPERRAWPRRGNLTIGVALITFFALSGLVLLRYRFGRAGTATQQGTPL